MVTVTVVNGSEHATRAAPQASRINRKPTHPFYVQTQPFQIQPMFLAPVLPGETVENIQLQARVLSQPLKNGLMGWWKEYYFFYVKLRDLDNRDEITSMMLDPGYVLNAGLENARNRQMNLGGDIAGQHINWNQLCLKRVVEEYFRDEGEAWDTAMLDGLPMAKINMNDWCDSARLDTELTAIPEDETLPGEYPSVMPDSVPPGFETHYTQWEHMRALKLTTANFDDYLKSFGVRVPKAAQEDSHVPELIRYIRDWTYPTRHGDGTYGVGWNVAERADKNRFIKEPGFLFGVTVSRPKVYVEGKWDGLTAYMRTAFDWLPAILVDDPYTSLKKFAAGTGPLAIAGDGPVGDYWVDIRDLFLHGEHFLNVFPSLTGVNYIRRDSNHVRYQYPLPGDLKEFFADPLKKTLEEDGVVNLVIQGRLHETS
jgi:hypothetical protein